MLCHKWAQILLIQAGFCRTLSPNCSMLWNELRAETCDTITMRSGVSDGNTKPLSLL